jgi:hypothetical protein
MAKIKRIKENPWSTKNYTEGKTKDLATYTPQILRGQLHCSVNILFTIKFYTANNIYHWTANTRLNHDGFLLSYLTKGNKMQNIYMHLFICFIILNQQKYSWLYILTLYFLLEMVPCNFIEKCFSNLLSDKIVRNRHDLAVCLQFNDKYCLLCKIL